MADFTIKQGDTKPNLVITLRDANDNLVDLTGSTIVLHISDPGGTVIVNEEIEESQTPTDGTITWEPTSDLTQTPGYYYAEYQIVFPDLSVQTFPNSKRGLVIEVIKQIL